MLSKELTGMGEVSDLPLQLQTASLQFSDRKPEFFLHKIQEIRHLQNMQKRDCDIVASLPWLHFVLVLVIRKFRSRCQLLR